MAPRAPNDMPDAPLVSVIIPCYNGSRFLAEAIESVLAQAHENLELIVVDDGSTDDSLEIVRGFGDRVRSEPLPHNQGVNFARNRGVEVARGEFLQFLDSDDLLRPEKIARSLEVFDDDDDVVFTGVESFGEVEVSHDLPAPPSWYGVLRRWLGRAAGSEQVVWDPSFPAEFFVLQGAQTAQLLHRKANYLRTGGFDRQLFEMDDWEFHFRLALAGTRFRRIPDPLVAYRHHEGPGRLRLSPRRADTALHIFRMMVEQARAADALDGRLRRALAARMAVWARALLRQDRPDHAREVYAMALDLDFLPRGSASPLYDVLARVAGIERAEALYLRLRGA
ncbi:MAG: glycosyltransferase [Myxococcales bacterium]|nr:glycosyltransferase [Myxococcales bacterium]